MKTRSIANWATAGLATVLICGCSGGTAGVPEITNLVPLSGIVELDNKPLAHATITFHPKTTAGFHGATGVTDETGKYELETDVGNGKIKKGAIPGTYNITVTKLVKPDGTPFVFDPKLGGPMNQGASMQMVPMKYATVNDFGLYFIIPAGGGTFDIKMEAGGG